MDTTTRRRSSCSAATSTRVMAAFIIANGAAAMGDDVTIFATFWGLNILRKTEKVQIDGQEEHAAVDVRQDDAARAPASSASPR